jgi:hypothetical protein
MPDRRQRALEFLSSIASDPKDLSTSSASMFNNADSGPSDPILIPETKPNDDSPPASSSPQQNLQHSVNSERSRLAMSFLGGLVGVPAATTISNVDVSATANMIIEPEPLAFETATTLTEHDTKPTLVQSAKPPETRLRNMSESTSVESSTEQLDLISRRQSLRQKRPSNASKAYLTVKLSADPSFNMDILHHEARIFFTGPNVSSN